MGNSVIFWDTCWIAMGWLWDMIMRYTQCDNYMPHIMGLNIKRIYKWTMQTDYYWIGMHLKITIQQHFCSSVCIFVMVYPHLCHQQKTDGRRFELCHWSLVMLQMHRISFLEMFSGWWFGQFFQHIGNFIIPTDELHHFSEGWQKTTNQRFSRMGILPNHPK